MYSKLQTNIFIKCQFEKFFQNCGKLHQKVSSLSCLISSNQTTYVEGQRARRTFVIYLTHNRFLKFERVSSIRGYLEGN